MPCQKENKKRRHKEKADKQMLSALVLEKSLPALPYENKARYTNIPIITIFH